MNKNKIKKQDKGRKIAIEISNPHFARLGIIILLDNETYKIQSQTQVLDRIKTTKKVSLKLLCLKERKRGRKREFIAKLSCIIREAAKKKFSCFLHTNNVTIQTRNRAASTT